MGAVYDILRLSRVMLGYHYIGSKSALLKNRFTERFPIKKNSDISEKPIFKIILFIEDFLFSVIFAVVFAIALFYGNGGEFRALFLVAMLLGFFSYLFSVGKITVLFFDIWVIYLRTLILYLLFYLKKPIAWAWKKNSKIFKKISLFFAQILENMKIKGYNKKERTILQGLSEDGMLKSRRNIKCQKRKKHDLGN